MPHGPLESIDLICFSHLRWDFVFQRPQHLLTRCANERRVYYFEEPVYDSDTPWLQLERRGTLTVATPHVPQGLSEAEVNDAQRALVNDLITRERIRQYVLWYYTPMALSFSQHLAPAAIVYDCMDQLSAFRGAPPTLTLREQELLARADVVFTGGQSLYEAKRHAHPNVKAFPSSVDVAHFSMARRVQDDPADQVHIPRPRLGFFGVIDERMDLGLLAGVAEARPDWHLVMIGPVVKIDSSMLPRAANLHYLGSKSYAELPSYIAGWDVALLPFARVEATRFISPTKTPEYMAAGKPVVSTSITDVIRPYGQRGLVRIADTVEDFVLACEASLAEDSAVRMREADAFLRQTSWDGTWAQMRAEMLSCLSTPAVPVRAARAL